MTEPIEPRSPNSPAETSRLNYNGIYTCPACRHGEISAIALMDAFACDFCRHIFTANLETQVLKMTDSLQPLTWYWNGRNWQGARREGVELGWGIVVGAIAFVLFPPSLVGLATYLFPPLPHSPLSWFPSFWTGLTFVSHLTCVIWLMVEYYQFPVFVYLRTWQRYLLGRR